MARATVVKPKATIYLELDEAEALYVHSALRLVEPANQQFANSDWDDHDPVHTALAAALQDAGLPTHEVHAARL